MAHQKGEPVECVYLYLPNSPRGASRDLIIDRSLFNLDTVLCGEAYAYSNCTAYRTAGIWGNPGGFTNPCDMGQKVWLGSIILPEDFDSDAWLKAFPPKRVSTVDKEYYESLFDFKHVKCLVVDRYGAVHKVISSETVEPLEWGSPPPPVAIITPKPGYDDYSGAYLL